MIIYYCPFCSITYQFNKTNSERLLICTQCGDTLIKKPLINSRKTIGIFTALVFLSPLIIMMSFIIKEFGKDKILNNSESAILLTFKL